MKPENYKETRTKMMTGEIENGDMPLNMSEEGLVYVSCCETKKID